MLRNVALLTVGLALLAGCGSSGNDTQQSGVSVVASHYPAQFLAERVGGELVQVDNLTSPGTEPHDVELSPQQVGQVAEADAVFYIGGFQPSVDNAIPEAQGEVVDLSAGLPVRTQDGQTDPHVWLDPVLMSDMATTVSKALSTADPEHAQQYETNAQNLQAELADLDSQWQRGTRKCATRTMVVSHDAFGYLADRYGFTQKGIAGLSPETEPSAQALAELARYVQDNDVTTVYTETLVDPAVAQTVAAEAGAKTATLDPLEGPPATGDYLSAMRQNLAEVRDGQRCT